MDRREFMAGGVALGLSISRLLEAVETRWEPSMAVMDTWFLGEKSLDVQAQVALVKKLGYGGMALTLGRENGSRMKALRESGLEMPGLYVPCDLSRDSSLKGAVDVLKGSRGFAWVGMGWSHRRPSDPGGDAIAAAFVSTCADECTAAGLPGIALYPQAGTWMEKVGDAVRVAQRVGRPDVGVVFNQFDWMASEPRQDLRKTLESAMPHLKAVTINGSAMKASILPLSEGEYDVVPILQALVDFKYAGPVVLQGIGIEGSLAERLEASMKRWEELKKKVRATPGEIVRAHLFISGIVQGVSYRASTEEQARKRGVTGWVKNLEDGRVEALLQGPKLNVDEIIEWCHRGPSAAKVERIVLTWEKAADEFKNFEVRY